MPHTPGHASTALIPACFRTLARPTRITPLGVRLPAKYAEAFAELLPMLLCGEESANLVFDHYARSVALPQTVRDDLERMGADEARHAILLQRVRLSLPSLPEDAQDNLALRRFYRSLQEREPARHLMRIAALDSAVCMVLGVFRRGPLGADRVLGLALAQIHRDESRHVVVAACHARSCAAGADLRAVASATRELLTDVLRRRANALERLEVCPDRLFRRLSRLQPILFA